MLRKTVLISAVVALLTVTGSARGMNAGGDGSKGHSIHHGSQGMVYSDRTKGDLLTDIPLSELTDTQKEELLFMIEEEKVARDVYTHLYNTWNVRVFSNIARAEQRHVDAIQALLDRYELEAPLTLDDEGVFENDKLQALYDELIAKGERSLVDALSVGVTIEEMDIADLEEILDAGVPEDFAMIYENLLKGSYHHLNAFNRQLARQ